MRFASILALGSILSAQIAVTPVMAQMTTMPVDNPTTKPVRPVRPTPVTPPVTPLPKPVRPEIQPPRPRPEIQPPRPGPEMQPPRPVPPRPVILPPQPGYQSNFANALACAANGNRERSCRAATGNRVVISRIFSGQCRAVRDWSFSSYDIRVRNGCHARFLYGYANGNPTPLPQPVPDRDRDRGPSAGAVIAGVVVAGGLIAILANVAKKKDQTASTSTPTTFPPGPPATVSADLAALPKDARPTMQNCLFAAAREIGVTGGSRMRLDRVTKIEPGNGGWRFNADLTSTYPDGDRETPIYCRATPTKIVQLDFGQ